MRKLNDVMDKGLAERIAQRSRPGSEVYRDSTRGGRYYIKVKTLRRDLWWSERNIFSWTYKGPIGELLQREMLKYGEGYDAFDTYEMMRWGKMIQVLRMRVR